MQQWKQYKRMIPGKVIPKVGRSYIFAISIGGAPRIPMTYDNIPNRIRHKASKLPKQASD